MRCISYLLLVIFTNCAFAQKLPVVKAVSNRAKIYEQGNPVSNWTITPKVKHDIFITNKLTGTTTVSFKTDSDSVAFKLKPGEKRDFIVVLNGKDSCYTTIQSPPKKDFSKIKPEIHDSIPFRINEQNTIYIQAVFNKKDTLALNFDTGTTDLVLTDEVLKTKIKSHISLYDTAYDLEIGKRCYKTMVYDAQLTGHDTSGRFGWNLFDGMIVELDYNKNLMLVHSKMPGSIKKDKAYTKLDIKYLSQLFFVTVGMEQNEVEKSYWFLFDTGYQRAIMLDNDLLSKNNFPAEKMDIIKKVMMHGAQGNEIPVITSLLQKMKLGNYELAGVPAQLLTTNKPMPGTEVHILGNEIIKRFNVVLDFQNNIVYLKPNKYFHEQYAEKK